MNSTDPRSPTRWFLSASGRGNAATRLDAQHPGEQAWSYGNQARPLIHGATYFAELFRCLEQVGEGDLVYFTDWQGNADERLTGEPGSELVDVLGRALDRGADVRALIWRSHARAIGYTAEDHISLGVQLRERGADVQLDMRVRANGSHHQKFVVIRHAHDSGRDIAFVGGIDLCHTRRDDALHHGDVQGDPIASEYGDRPPWHDVQVALQGPVVHDVETVFRERWEDRTPLTRNPLRKAENMLHALDDTSHRLSPQAPAPQPVEGYQHAVQLLRTYPQLGPGWAFDFAPNGERSVARGYTKAVGLTSHLIYIEDQFMWGRTMSAPLVRALRENPDLHLIAVLPRFPDHDGWFARDPQMFGRLRAIQRLQAVAPGRVAFYSPENHAGTPVYVHAKVCVLDDVWASIGSDNFCRRSWTNDSELTAAVIDQDADSSRAGYARRLRLTLAAEHLDRLDPDQLVDVDAMDDAGLLDVMADCVDPSEMFDRFAESAEALERWHQAGQKTARPPGRLRRLPDPSLPWWRRAFAAPWFRQLHDPDGRPLVMRWRRRF